MKLPLSLRNLTRQRMRTAIAFAAISFSVVALVLAGGFFEWLLWHVRESTIESRLGHIQIVKKGFRENGTAAPYDYLLPADSPELAAIRELPEAKAVAARLNFTGVISLNETTISFMGEGVQPKEEAEISRQVAITAGENLSEDDPNGIIIGAGLAATIGAKPGDKIVLLSTASTGGMNGVEGHVRGLYSTFVKAYDDASLKVPLPLARKLVRVSGAHTWVVLLNKTEQTETIVERLNKSLETSDLQVISWRELADFYNKSVTLFSKQINVIRVMIALVVLLSISNTLIMSVLERTGEIGTLMALGSTSRRVLSLFLSEAFFLGLIGGLLGVILSYMLAQLISAVGIPMPPLPGSSRAFLAKISVSGSLAFGAWLLVLFTTMLASIYPAWKGSRLNIVDALRHNK
ncbi:MAG TPA: FtsX-like permease family protein [Burkholderiales bacterium]|nr:FtsX-like permease family protein [Burkholderiales bacterium]